MAAADQAADLVDVERLLGDQDHVGAAGNARVERDPAGVTAHDLDHHHPMVGLGGGVKPVDRLGGDVQRGVEAEGDVGGADVVVDRLRHPDHVETMLGVEAVGGAEGVLAADCDQTIEAEIAHGRGDRLRAVVALERIRPRGAEDGAAAGQDAARRLDRKLLGVAFQRTAPAVAKADDLISVNVDSLSHHGADYGVEAGTIPAPGQHS